MSTTSRSATLVATAVLALAAVTGTSAVAAPTAQAGASQVKKLVKKEIAKAAPSLSVAKAKTADTATSATTATNAATAANAQALGGKSLAQVQTVINGATNTSVVNDIGAAGTDVVTLNYTLPAPSRVNFSGVVELGGDNSAGGLATCVIRNDGNGVSAAFETTFDDLGTSANNPAVDVVLTSVASVAPGAHTATLRCSREAFTVSKDDAAINMVAVPN